MPIILGLNINHADSAACIIKDNKLVFAIEEEKLNIQKHWAGLPILAINECIKNAGINADQLTDISLNTNPLSNFSQKTIYFTKNLSDKNDMIFEQPRDNLLQQEFTSFEYTDKGIKRSTTVRKYKKNGDYNDITSIEFIGS